MTEPATCEILFCQNDATARFSAPKLKPRFLICEACLAEQMAWAKPYRKTPGAVRVETIGA